MATIKNFTSLEQSKKLEEILPLDSADMNYALEDFVDEDTGDVFSIEKVSFSKPSSAEIGCWSLAALLGVLPNENMLVKTTDGEYYCLAKDVMTKHYDNPVDACVTMVEKLNELKML